MSHEVAQAADNDRDYAHQEIDHGIQPRVAGKP